MDKSPGRNGSGMALPSLALKMMVLSKLGPALSRVLGQEEMSLLLGALVGRASSSEGQIEGFEQLNKPKLTSPNLHSSTAQFMDGDTGDERFIMFFGVLGWWKVRIGRSL